MRVLPASFLSIAIAGGFLLGACGRETVAPLPQGVQTVDGTLQAVPLSLKRRGTHALLDASGVIAAYVESRSVDLSRLDGHEVKLRGTYEANIDDHLPPVFVVEGVLEGGEEGLRPWSIPALGLSMKLPKSWNGNLKGATATFTGSGSMAATLVIRAAEAASSASSAAASSSPGGEMLSVGLRRAEGSLSDDERTWVVRIEPSRDGARSALVFTFLLRPELPADAQISQFKRLLRSVEFSGSQGSSAPRPSSAASTPSAGGDGSSLAPSSGSPEGSPCGGPAGILCPAGYYCRITDVAIDAGVCAKR